MPKKYPQIPKSSRSTGEKQAIYYKKPPILPRATFDILTSEYIKELITYSQIANQGYAICICNVPKLREDLISALAEDLKSHKIGVYKLILNTEDQSLGRRMRILLESEEFQSFQKDYQKILFNVVGLDTAIQEEEKEFARRPAVLQGINQQRDYFRTLPFPLLIWIPEWLAAKLPEFAPDFWVGRSTIFEFLTTQEIVAQSVSQLGGYEISFENIEEAKRKMRIYEKLIKSSEDLPIKATFSLNLGILHQKIGNYSEAERLYNESLRIFKELNAKKEEAAVLHQLGMIQQARGNYSEAERLYNESLRIAEELGNKVGIAITIGQLGRLAEAKGNDEDALKNYLIALKIFEEMKLPNSKIVSNWLVKMKEKLGEEKFKELYQKATTALESKPHL